MILGTITYAQVEYSAESNKESPVNFFVDVAGYKSKIPDKTRMDFFIQVPYSSVQFVKRDDGFYAGYNITLTFTDQSKTNILFETNWKEKIRSNDFAQTLSNNNFNFSYKTYDLKPGKYYVKCIVEDSDSKKSSFRNINLTVRSINDTLGISDIMYIADIIKDSTGEKIVPNISASVTNESKKISFYFDIYSNKDQQVFLEYNLDDAKKDSTFKQTDPQNLKTGSNTIKHTFNSLNLKPGIYTIKVILKDKDWKEITSVEKILYSKIYGVPINITDIQKAVDQMLYIASPQELSYIKNAKDNEEMLERFLAFWDKHKPDKNSEENPIQAEYYRRIDYANKNFKGFGEGWHSDMGMIYVTFGPPSNVERHPFDSDSKPYEIWSYFEQNRTFIFIDQTGFGDYRLYNADYSRWPGYH